MSDKTTPGYDYFASAPPAAPPIGEPGSPPSAPPFAPPAMPPAQGGPSSSSSMDGNWRLNPATFAPAEPYRLPRWANLVFSLVAVALIGSLVVAVAIPMTKRHQLSSQWKNTTISLPATFGGQPRRAVDQPATVSELTGDRFGAANVALYGKNPLSLVLIVAAKPKQAMSDEDQGQARSQFVKGFTATSNGVSLQLTEVADAGPLGGWLGCGQASGASVCVATDPGSMVAVVMGPSTKNPQTVAVQARQAAVTRS